MMRGGSLRCKVDNEAWCARGLPRRAPRARRGLGESGARCQTRDWGCARCGGVEVAEETEDAKRGVWRAETEGARSRWGVERWWDGYWGARLDLVHLAAELIAVVFDHRIGDGGDVPRHDRIEFVEGEVDAVVGEPILGEVVGADPLAAVAGTDQPLACFSPFAHFLFPFLFVDAGFEDAERFGEVFVLALFVLALDDDAGFEVG